MTDRITFESRDGLRLEGAWDRAGDARGVIVFCHPHPRMGGTMNAPLVRSVADGLVAAGWAVLRFNFRGIGSSEGEPSTGIDEVNDAAGAIHEARRRQTDGPLVLVGWSFGGAVALRTARQREDVAACVAIAPAVNEKPGVTSGLPAPSELSLAIPVLFVTGANDDVVSIEDCKQWVQQLDAGHYVELPGANHFFWGKYDDLTRAIVEWLEDVL